MVTPRLRQRIVLRCPSGHKCDTTVEDVTLTHTLATILGARFVCERCREQVDVALPANTIAVLAELGVRPSERELSVDHEPFAVSEQRRAVSIAVLDPITAVVPVRS